MSSSKHTSPQPTHYSTRKPQATAFYQCVEDHFETLERVHDERFSRQYGFFRLLLQAPPLLPLMPIEARCRKLLCELSRCARETLKQYLQKVLPAPDAQPGAVIAVQTFGGLLEFNPHCHILLADGGFYGKDMFRVATRPEIKPIEELFRRKVFRIPASPKDSPELIDNLMG